MPDGEPPASCDSAEPDKYYPSGNRNYLRVVANDAYQGSADAEFAQSAGREERLHPERQAGLRPRRRDELPRCGGSRSASRSRASPRGTPKATSYTSLCEKIKQTGADAVFIGGLTDENGGQLIKDKVAVLGPNDGAVKLLAPDGFTQQSTIKEAGSASAGMYASVAGQPIDKFKGTAKVFIDGLRSGPLSGATIDPYAIYGGQAGSGVARRDRRVGRLALGRHLEAVRVRRDRTGCSARSRSTRTAIRSARLRATVAITIYKAEDTFKTVTTIAPKQTTVDAALGK